jgi:hypothetical protein
MSTADMFLAVTITHNHQPPHTTRHATRHDTHGVIVITFEEIDGLEELVLADAQMLGGLEEVGDVLHLHEGRRGLLNPRHRAGVERVGQPTFIHHHHHHRVRNVVNNNK